MTQMPVMMDTWTQSHDTTYPYGHDACYDGHMQSHDTTYLYGHDACYDGHSYPYLSTVMIKLEEGVSLEEQLSNDEVCSSLYLLLQVLQVIFVTGTVWMPMGVTL